MDQEHWNSVERYTAGLLAMADPPLREAVADSAKAGLPAIQVSPVEGKMLMIWAQAVGAKRILEIGTLGGYSAIWLARALPKGGKLITLEAEAKHAEVARANIARAGLADKVDIRLGLAIESLPKLAAENGGPFDFTFVDADKEHTWDYFDWAVKMSRRGSLIAIDNVIRHGALVNGDSTDVDVRGMRRFCEMVAKDKRVNASVIQTVGSKGYDGFALAVVLAER